MYISASFVWTDKPKVFIIQACRAPRRDKADDMETSSREETPDEATQATFKKPVNADMLISYATSKGKPLPFNCFFLHLFLQSDLVTSKSLPLH